MSTHKSTKKKRKPPPYKPGNRAWSVVGHDLTEEHIREFVGGRKPHVKAVGIVHDRDPGSREHGHVFFFDPKTKRSAEAVQRMLPVPVIVKPFIYHPDEPGPMKGKHAPARGARYCTHEHPEQQAKGKALYGDDEVIASPGWDWRADVDALNAYEGIDPAKAAKQTLVDRLTDRILDGELTARDVRRMHSKTYKDRGPAFWEGYEKRAEQWRADDREVEERQQREAQQVEESRLYAEQQEAAQKAREEAEKREAEAEAQRAAEEAQRAAQEAREAEEAAARREDERREHEERLATDPEYRAEHERQLAREKAEARAAHEEAEASRKAQKRDLKLWHLKDRGHLKFWEEWCALEEAQELRVARLEERATERAAWHEANGCEVGCVNDAEHEPGDEEGQCFDGDIAGDDDPVMRAMLDRSNEVEEAADGGRFFVNRATLDGLDRKAAAMLARYEKKHTRGSRRG
ncbi:hypothetical protein [Leucobacter chromiireducens]|uniref:hypothetical protein n=1 Tax=Leucobacter chromiireducens TaxID=283877 RepID=UPI00192600D4|nr:hypothetical protein [Leucobacter chromiireducens]